MRSRVVVMGTTDFAVPMLNRLTDSDYEVVAVVCQPDRPNGRGKKMRALPMKQRALKLGLSVYQPEKIRNVSAIDYLKSLRPDFFVVAAYGQILSQEVLDIPTYGCLNIHGSLLPEYRGAAPVHHAIIDGKAESGVTIMKMDLGMDTGDMLAQKIIPITDTTTVGKMHDAMAKAGADLILNVMAQIQNGTAQGIEQDSAKATYAEKIDKNTGRIDWHQSCFQILRRINGTDPWPGAWTTLDGRTFKCFLPVRLPQAEKTEVPGCIVAADENQGLVVAAGDGYLQLNEIQMPGKRRMRATDYFRGNAIAVGTVLS